MTTTPTTLAEAANRLAETLADCIEDTTGEPYANDQAVRAYRKATDVVVAVRQTPVPEYVTDCMEAARRLIVELGNITIYADDAQEAWELTNEYLGN